MIDVFGLTRDATTPGGQDLYTGTAEAADGPVDLLASRALEPGPRAIMATLANLRAQHDPAMFILIGIGGGIRNDLDINDVVVATRVVYYDQRRETAGKVYRRGDEKQAPADIGHAVNSFFTVYGDPARLRSRNGQFHVRSGHIGSGDAVIMDSGNAIRRYLSTYNENVLAVDMEAGGLAQFCHESDNPPGWLVVRGISDLADRAKVDDHQGSAAHNAAVALQHLVPYLRTKARSV